MNFSKYDIIGKTFNNLVVIDFLFKKGKNRLFYSCKCYCGNKIIVRRDRIISGNTKSCGCLKLKQITNLGILSKTHGMSKTPFYKKYCSIKTRCENIREKCFPRYGGAGIKCLWKSFEDFKKDMFDSYLEHIKSFGRKNTQIDRINSKGNYSKNNCRWVTLSEQSRNKSNTRWITFNGKTKCLREWSNILGIEEGTISYRIKNGWNTKKALTTKIIN